MMKRLFCKKYNNYLISKTINKIKLKQLIIEFYYLGIVILDCFWFFHLDQSKIIAKLLEVKYNGIIKWLIWKWSEKQEEVKIIKAKKRN